MVHYDTQNDITNICTRGTRKIIELDNNYIRFFSLMMAYTWILAILIR